MSNITDGTTSVTPGGMYGSVVPSGYIAADITRAGVPGLAQKAIGFRGEPYTLRTWHTVANIAALATLKIYCLLLKKQVCTVTDSAGNVWYYQIVDDVQFTNEQKMLTSTDTNAYFLEVVWTLRSAATSY